MKGQQTVWTSIYSYPSRDIENIKWWECTWLCNCNRAQGVMDEKNKNIAYFNNAIFKL